MKSDRAYMWIVVEVLFGIALIVLFFRYIF